MERSMGQTLVEVGREVIERERREAAQRLVDAAQRLVDEDRRLRVTTRWGSIVVRYRRLRWLKKYWHEVGTILAKWKKERK